MTGKAPFPLIVDSLEYRFPFLICYVNTELLGFGLLLNAWRKGKRRICSQVSVIDFSHGTDHRQRLKRGSKWERPKKCAQQAPSVFSSRLLWPQPHFLNCQWLSGTIYTHQSQGLSYLFYLLLPLFLFVFVSFLTVRYLSSLPVL